MNQRQIQSKLKESVFAPSKPGPLKIIADVWNSDYYINRAIEMLAVSLDKNLTAGKPDLRRSAISLIALARVLDE